MPDENDANLPDFQFGFRKGRGTDFCSTTLNDVMAYAALQNTPLFISALDAEKCFDRIWHSGLLHKLIDILPLYYWLLCATGIEVFRQPYVLMINTVTSLWSRGG
jgi:retron-type reverse transcriptase